MSVKKSYIDLHTLNKAYAKSYVQRQKSATRQKTALYVSALFAVGGIVAATVGGMNLVGLKPWSIQLGYTGALTAIAVGGVSLVAFPILFKQKNSQRLNAHQENNGTIYQHKSQFNGLLGHKLNDFEAVVVKQKLTLTSVILKTGIPGRGDTPAQETLKHEQVHPCLYIKVPGLEEPLMISQFVIEEDAVRVNCDHQSFIVISKGKSSPSGIYRYLYTRVQLERKQQWMQETGHADEEYLEALYDYHPSEAVKQESSQVQKLFNREHAKYQKATKRFKWQALALTLIALSCSTALLLGATSFAQLKPIGCIADPRINTTLVTIGALFYAYAGYHFLRLFTDKNRTFYDLAPKTIFPSKEVAMEIVGPKMRPLQGGLIKVFHKGKLEHYFLARVNKHIFCRRVEKLDEQTRLEELPSGRLLYDSKRFALGYVPYAQRDPSEPMKLVEISMAGSLSKRAFAHYLSEMCSE